MLYAPGMNTSPQLILVTGGARSGKSTFAEQLAADLGGDAVSYIATAEARDEEMHDRIARHRAERNASWETIEAPMDVSAAIRAASHDVVLLDCLTLLVSNHLLASGEESATNQVGAFLDACRVSGKHVVIVTNEVGWSIVPMNQLARQFRDLQGLLNRKVMSAATSGYLVVAGQALKIKDAP